MTSLDKTETSKLFRRPRKPNLERINLKIDVNEFYAGDEDANSSDENYEDDSSERERDESTTTAKLPSLNHIRFNHDGDGGTDHLVSIMEETTLDSSSYDKTVYLYSDAILNSLGGGGGSSKIVNNNKSSSVSPPPMTNKHYTSRTSGELLRQSLMRPYKTLGPDPLPSRPPKMRAEDVRERKYYYQSLSTNKTGHAGESFELNDFLLDSRYNERLVASCVKYISKYTYSQMCRLLEAQIQEERNKYSHQEKLHIQTLEPNIEPVVKRKPMRQTMIEMANYLKNELCQKTGVNLKTKFKSLPKWQRMKEGAHSELIIYEDNSKKDEFAYVDEEIEDEEITQSHIAVVDCLLRNGLALSLKAYAIDTLPDLSALRHTLVYINLSYNHFKEFPKSLFEIPTLEFVKLRNNPIRYLPDALGVLINLKCLILAYCQLKELNISIYELENLVELDVSYNRLDKIDDDIVKLRNLKLLNYEGNELEYLPCCMLRMAHLESLKVKNNYLHPLIWRKYLSNDVQSLKDLAAVKFCKVYGNEDDSIEFDNLDYELKSFIKRYFKSDC